MPEDLTVFVNSAQWTLCEHSGSFARIRLVNIVVNIASSVSNDPVLHFILYVPSVTQRPLYILDADGARFTQASFALTDSRQNQVQHLSQLPSSCPNGAA